MRLRLKGAGMDVRQGKMQIAYHLLHLDLVYLGWTKEQTLLDPCIKFGPFVHERAFLVAVLQISRWHQIEYLLPVP